MGNYDNTYYRQIDNIGRMDQYSFSYVDSKTIEVNGDLTDFLRIGLAIFFEASGTEYSGYITGTPTLVSGNTQFDVLLNDSSGTIVDVPNATLENVQLSSMPKFSKHLGEINLTIERKEPSPNISTISQDSATLKTIGKRVFIDIQDLEFTVSSNEQYVSIQAPIPSPKYALGLIYTNKGNVSLGYFQIIPSISTTEIRLYRGDGATWPSASASAVWGCINYNI